jgi:hypothetical protein
MTRPRFWLFAALAVLLVLLCCQLGPHLVVTPNPCEVSCYTGPAKTRGVGACHDGVPTCSDAGDTVIACPGEQLPGRETCNGVDDDCDGLVDNDVGDGGPCYTGPEGTQGVGICHAGSLACVDAGWACQGQELPVREVCNCLDNDCDGVIGDIPVGQPCYDGPGGTEGVGACHGGSLACGAGSDCGTSYCASEVLPQLGVCVDAYSACGVTAQGLVDFVFILDDMDPTCLGGMPVQDFIDAQQTSVEFAYGAPQEFYHYGLVDTPGCGGLWVPAPSPGGYTLELPLAAEPDFLPVATLQCVLNVSDNSACAAAPMFYPLDIIYWQATGVLAPWDAPPGQRYLVMFTAAPAAGSLDMNLDAPEVQAVLAREGVILVVFATPAARASYDPLVGSGPGATFALGGVVPMLAEVQLEAQLSLCPDGGA